MKNPIFRMMAAGFVALGWTGGDAWAAPPASTGQWDKDVLKLFSEVPVQEDGRIKPLDTFAAFKLLKLNGKRYYKPDEGGRLTPIEWLLDCLFYPEAVEDYRHFRIADSEIITAIGGVAHADRWDYYSYKEIILGRDKLFELAREYAAKEESDRSTREQITLDLAHNVNEFELLTHFMEFARRDFAIQGSPILTKLFDGHDAVTLSQVVGKATELQRAVMTIEATTEEGEQPLSQSEAQVLTHVFNALDFASNFAVALALIPPASPGDKVWQTPADLMGSAFTAAPPADNELAILGSLERLAHNVDNKLAFNQEAAAFHDLVVGQAKARGEYGAVSLEVSFYKGKFFFYAQWLFVVSFILVAISWLAPSNKFLYRMIGGAITLPLLLLVIGIVLRCIIRGRPPVSTLYETILFITAVSVMVALFMEWTNRQRIAMAVASALGVFGMFLANKFEISQAEDTMPQLVAVLDTNFWLSTHVTSVTIGYSAGLLAAAVAHVYIIGRLFNFKKDNPAFYRNITRMVYGIVCFGLLFSFVGTVLGGIWANYSWGRFWGWDPKENGALMIVLCNLAILHARNGGYIKQMGLHLAAVFAGGVVAFSWWGVNLLGVGLHSSGFTAGIWNSLTTFWGIEALTMAAGFFVLFRQWILKKAIERVQAEQAVGIGDLAAK